MDKVFWSIHLLANAIWLNCSLVFAIWLDSWSFDMLLDKRKNDVFFYWYFWSCVTDNWRSHESLSKIQNISFSLNVIKNKIKKHVCFPMYKILLETIWTIWRQSIHFNKNIYFGYTRNCFEVIQIVLFLKGEHIIYVCKRDLILCYKLQ